MAEGDPAKLAAGDPPKDMEVDSDSEEEALRKAMSPETIWRRVETRTDPAKGRVLHTKAELKAGCVVFAEEVLFCSTPDQAPELFAEVQAGCERTALALPAMWHFAGALALVTLDPAKLKQFNSKWVPAQHEHEAEEAAKLLAVCPTLQKAGLTAQALHRATLVFRYNSFGHKEEPNGLAVYDVISFISHSCDPNVIWHYGDGLTSVLIAKRALGVGEELSISYIADDDLYKSTEVRREKLRGWLFDCRCERCALGRDLSAGFVCPTCFQGAVYWNHDGGKFMPCGVCSHVPTRGPHEQYLRAEEHYKASLESVDKSDLSALEAFYEETSKLFHCHWIQSEILRALFDKYKELKQYEDAAVCQQKRVEFFTHSLPAPSYTSAWAFEELGEALQAAMHGRPSACRKREMLLAYKRSYSLLIILCGRTHQYTCNAYGKYLDAGGDQP